MKEAPELGLYCSSARNTIALLLSSAISPRQNPLDTSHMAATKARLQDSDYDTTKPLAWNPSPSKATVKAETELHHTLANEIIKNLSSLTYHHLSPHTQMQALNPNRRGLKKPMLAGAHASNAARAQPGMTSDDVALDELGGTSDAFAMDNSSFSPFSSQYHIPSLQVPPKPTRGPVGSKPKRWDGQNPTVILALGQQRQRSDSQASSTTAMATIQSLEARVAVLREQHAIAKQKEESDGTTLGGEKSASNANRRKPNSNASPADQLLRQMREVRGVLKSTRFQFEKEQRNRAIVSLPQERLKELIRNVEATERVWVGGERMSKWAKGEWLSP